MNVRTKVLGIAGAIALAVGGCAAGDKTTATPNATPDKVSPAADVVPDDIASGSNATSGNAASAPQAQPLAGWYLQGASGSRLQPCGQSQQWPIGDKADLEARARAFDLQDDTPVYVRLLARVSDAHDPARRVDVVKVEQFGSSTPVRDCAMTGVVMPAPGA